MSSHGPLLVRESFSKELSIIFTTLLQLSIPTHHIRYFYLCQATALGFLVCKTEITIIAITQNDYMLHEYDLIIVKCFLTWKFRNKHYILRQLAFGISQTLRLSKENFNTKPTAWMPWRNCCHIFVIPFLEADSEGSQVQDQAGLHESLPLKKGVGGGMEGQLPQPNGRAYGYMRRLQD